MLVTPRLRLRPLTLGDRDAMARLLADPQVMRYYPRPKTADEAEAWIRWNLDLYADRGYGLWAVERLDTGELIGDCGLTPQDVEGVTEVEIGYHLFPEQWHRGYATEAARACRDHAARLGHGRLVAVISPDNLPSRRVAEALGMTFERNFERDGLCLSLFSMTLPPTG